MKTQLTLFIFFICFISKAQDNPYASFGYESKVKYETNISSLLTVHNADTNSIHKKIVFDFQRKFVYYLNENDSILDSDTFDENDILMFMSVDPLTSKYPELSPYQFASNSPIMNIDREGLERYYAADGSYLGKYGKSDQIRVVNSARIINFLNISIGNVKKYGAEESESLNKSFVNNSLAFHQADKIAQKTITSSIYNENVKGKYPIQSMKIGDANNGAVAQTYEAGNFALFPQVTENKEYLADNFFNQVNIWYHEEQHSASRAIGEEGLGDVFGHFNILRKQTKHWSYTNTTEEFKSYIQQVGKLYLDGQAEELAKRLRVADKLNSREELMTKTDFRHYQKEYDKNVAFFEKQYGKKYKSDKKELLERRLKNADK